MKMRYYDEPRREDFDTSEEYQEALAAYDYAFACAELEANGN